MSHHFHSSEITVKTLPHEDGIRRKNFLQIILNIFKAGGHILQHVWRDPRIPAGTHNVLVVLEFDTPCEIVSDLVSGFNQLVVHDSQGGVDDADSGEFAALVS